MIGMRTPQVTRKCAWFTLKKKARGKRYGEGSLEEGGEKDEEQKNSDMAKRII